MKIVIRAGGVGTRLWPKSREKKPKQFQALVTDKSLIRETFERIKPLARKKSDIYVSINESMVDLLPEEIPEILPENIILEPASKNTGPAVCLESFFIAKNSSPEEVIASLPSDDYINNPEAFVELLKLVEDFLNEYPDFIVTPGVKPTAIDTGYSYIKSGKNLQKKGEEAIFQVADWVEKPSYERCKELIESGLYYYHTGMYIWKLKNILALFKKLQPEMYEKCEKIVSLDSKKNKKEISELYNSLEKISIEGAITDKAERIAMSVSNRIGWSDLGKWHIIKDLLPPNEGDNLVKGKTVLVDTTDCLVYGPKDKVVTTIGLDDMVIIDTKDALLVCPKERSGEVKKVVEELEKKKLKKYL